jgi:hypothetical protein
VRLGTVEGASPGQKGRGGRAEEGDVPGAEWANQAAQLRFGGEQGRRPCARGRAARRNEGRD